jgi:protein arginine kinase activator
MTEGKDAMRYCDDCGKNHASVHFTRIDGDSTVVLHLCDDCARKKGVSVSMIMEEPSGDEQPQASFDGLDNQVCPGCGMSFVQFKSTGRLGCEQCYRAFETDIDSLLNQVHGALVHKGKPYVKKYPIATEVKDLKRLRVELSDAIKKEEFELAAAIRDAIYSISDNSAFEEQTDKAR